MSKKLLPVLALLVSWLSINPAVADPAREAVEADWGRQEAFERRSFESPEALDAILARGRALVDDLRELGAEKVAAAGEAKLDDSAAKAKSVDPQGRRELYLQTRWTVRELALKNPLLDFDQVLFVRRHWPSIGHQCAHRVGESQRPGADLCVLTGLKPDGSVRRLTEGQLTPGGIGRPDLSFDAKRIVFPYAAPRPEPTNYAIGVPGARGGLCLMYDLYEIGVDGSGLRQVIDEPCAEDTEPCYLPDGRVAFTSSRSDRFVQCGDWALACGMFTVETDGSDVRRITEPKEGEFYPSMLADGRIIYTRWDYVMKPFNKIQQLWTVYPDGTRAQLVYGDHYTFTDGPIGFFEARQIPGTTRIVCTAGAHHNTCAGPIVIVDLAKNRGGPDGLVRITPGVGYPECPTAYSGSHGWYSSPYPLSEKHFLVSFSPEKSDNATKGYGLYLLDTHGNLELIYRDPDFSCYSPIPVRPRPLPHTLPEMVRGQEPDAPGVMTVADVYQGLPGVPRGTVKYLRILQSHSKPVHRNPQTLDVGAGSGMDPRGVLGTVPVEADGSAHFLVPPNTQIFFEAIDANFLEIRRMRNFMNLQPGERVSCVGCHESHATAVPGGIMPLAMRRGPSIIEPPPWGAEAVSFPELIQPILDRNCVDCHDGNEGAEKSFDLRGRQMVLAEGAFFYPNIGRAKVSDSFMALLPHVDFVKVGDYQGSLVPLAPYATGSAKSRLMQLLHEGHYDVAINRAEWRAFAAWIDCNAPYFGNWEDVDFVPPGGGPPALPNPPSAEQVEARRQQLQSQAPDGTRLAAYLDCGRAMASDKNDPVRILSPRGGTWLYTAEKIEGVEPGHTSIMFAGAEISLQLSGLKAGRRYRVGLSWWDFNSVARTQSVHAATADGDAQVELLGPTLLPQYEGKGELPGEFYLDLPKELTDTGAVWLTIRRESGANAVLSEAWVVE